MWFTNGIRKQKIHYMICGDININTPRTDENKIVEYINSLNSGGSINLINLPTTIAENCRPSLLDLVYTNVVTPKISGGICLAELSDHLPTFTFIKNCNHFKTKIK